MKRLPVQITLGAVVLVAGVLLFIQTAEWATIPGPVWAAVLAVASGAFWFVFFADAEAWWAAIPGAALAGAAVTPLMELDPDGLGQWTEVPMLALLGVGFAAIYLRDHRRWWAIIPAGVLLTLGIVSSLDSVSGMETGGLFFLGLGLTFLLVAALPGEKSGRSWALIPGVILLLFGALLGTPYRGLTDYLWPAVLIILGGYFVVRFFTGRSSH